MATLFDVRDDTATVDALQQSVAALQRGEIMVVPTDTVYGLAVSPQVPGAIERLVHLKGRDLSSPPPILVAGFDQVPSIVSSAVQVESIQVLLHHFWPGGLTVVLPRHPDAPAELGNADGTVAIRMPNEPVLLELLRMHGPLAVTSANRTGEPPCDSAYSALNVFGDRVGVYWDGGPRGEGSHQTPSTIIDLTELAAGHQSIRLIRAGAVSGDDIQRVLPGVTLS